MLRIILSVLAAVIFGGILSACAPAPKEMTFRTPPRPQGLSCDTATANIVTFGRSTAKLYSEIALKNQLIDLRGYMFNSGLRRIQLVQQTNDCVAGSGGGIFTGVYQCTARAQLCGR